MHAPTGEQHVLRRETPNGPAEAIITELAASIRTLRIGGVDLTQPYPESSLPPFAAGIVLVPWPNRVRDGHWELNGTTQKLDITEPDRNNASHGLLRNTGYRVLERSDDSVTLAATVFPQHGYKFRIDTTVRYELVDDGLRVTHTIFNATADAAPVAIGTHPFFRLGDVPTADLTLTVHGATRFPVDERLIPGEAIPVEGDLDLRGGVRVGSVELDDAYGELSPVDGVVAQLAAPDGRTVALWQDENFPYVQVFITDIFPIDGELSLAIAMEPMTAPANAFNSGESLRWVAPGETWTATWGIRYTA